jgi:hypothetical protein
MGNQDLNTELFEPFIARFNCAVNSMQKKGYRIGIRKYSELIMGRPQKYFFVPYTGSGANPIYYSMGKMSTALNHLTLNSKMNFVLGFKPYMLDYFNAGYDDQQVPDIYLGATKTQFIAYQLGLYFKRKYLDRNRMEFWRIPKDLEHLKSLTE